jgi:hypothetical protein
LLVCFEKGSGPLAILVVAVAVAVAVAVGDERAKEGLFPSPKPPQRPAITIRLSGAPAFLPGVRSPPANANKAHTRQRKAERSGRCQPPTYIQRTTGTTTTVQTTYEDGYICTYHQPLLHEVRHVRRYSTYSTIPLYTQCWFLSESESPRERRGRACFEPCSGCKS